MAFAYSKMFRHDHSQITYPKSSEAFFSRLQNRGGGQNLEGCGNFSTACSFSCTADARSDSENLQKFLKKWLFWIYLVPIISKPI